MDTSQNAKAPIGLLIVIIGIAIIAFRSCSPFERKLEWSVPLSNDDAFTVASVVLGQGKVRGCGDLEVDHVFGTSPEITVKCGDGRSHSLVWYPVFKIDGRTPDDLVWDRPRIESLYCVKSGDGHWQAAYIDRGNAITAALTESNKTDKQVRIYSSDSLIYGETSKTKSGEWQAVMNIDYLDDPDERRGCELVEAKRPN